jgi:hypothetical protein
MFISIQVLGNSAVPGKAVEEDKHGSGISQYQKEPVKSAAPAMSHRVKL